MDNEILNQLTPVRNRLDRSSRLQGLGAGLLRGAVAAVVLGVIRWPLQGLLPPVSWPVAQTVAAALALAAVILAAALGLRQASRKKTPWSSAAVAVDACYHLQDRTLTALGLAEKPERRPLEELALADARQALARLDPRRVVPVAVPRSLVAAMVLVAASAGLLAWPCPDFLRSHEAATSSDLKSLTENGLPSPRLREEASGVRGFRIGSKPSAAAPSTAVTRPAPGQLRWHEAPSGTVVPQYAGGPEIGLEKLLVGAGRSTGPIAEEERAPRAAVVETETASLEHRRTVRRYFASIQPEEAELLNMLPASDTPGPSEKAER